MPRSTKEEAQETRNRILDAAETMFHRHGVAHTSLADIATAAHVTRGAVYWHFKNKADLFNAMCERVRLPMEEMAASSASDSQADPLGALRATSLFVLQQASGNPHSRVVFAILFHKCEYVDAADPVYLRQQEAMQQGSARLQAVLSHAVDKGQLPAELDVVTAAAAYHSYISGLMNNWLFLPESFDLAGAAERMVDAGLDMLRNAPSFRKLA
jgi:TetR/AcrR family acrAB operon transcriptional repressor